MDLVDEFNDPNGDKFAFLISTRAGGVGLNLKAANKVRRLSLVLAIVDPLTFHFMSGRHL
jgi:hypothetical protein